MSGRLFETVMRAELSAMIQNSLISAGIYHWRTPYGHEVDIVIEYNNRLYAFECKWHSDVKTNDCAGLIAFKKQFKEKVEFSGVLTPVGHFGEVAEGIFQIPWFGGAL